MFHFFSGYDRALCRFLRLHAVFLLPAFFYACKIFAPVPSSDQIFISCPVRRKQSDTFRNFNRFFFGHIRCRIHLHNIVDICKRCINTLVKCDFFLIQMRIFQIYAVKSVYSYIFTGQNILMQHLKLTVSGIHTVECNRYASLILCLFITVLPLLCLYHSLWKITDFHFYVWYLFLFYRFCGLRGCFFRMFHDLYVYSVVGNLLTLHTVHADSCKHGRA